VRQLGKQYTEGTQAVKKKVWFEIGYKGFLGEQSEWFTEHIQAGNLNQALGLFAKRHGLKAEVEAWETWTWDDNDWLMEIRYCKEVKRARCRTCGAVDWEHVEAVWRP